MATATPRIAIIGAGPGGLMVASILHHNNIPCTIYERDSSAVARSQGGTLDIHEYSGQQALNAASLLDEFRARMRLGGEAIKIIAKDGTVLFEDDGGAKEEPQDNTTGQEGGEDGTKFIKGRPEIDRPALKDMLITGLPSDVIHWGKKVTSIVPVPDSKKWRIELDDGTRPTPFDLVIGADGAWSRTRALLSDQQPIYSGVTALDVWLHNVDMVNSKVSAFVGMGNCFLWDKDRALLFQRSGYGDRASARIMACVKTDSTTAPSAKALLGEEDDGAEVDWNDARVREKYIERHFGDWYDEPKEVIRAITQEPVLRHLWMLPVGFTWESRPGVTLVGDAAHLMTPFAGVGVNVALMDAFELARGITECVETGKADGEGLAAVVQRYEKGMFSCSGEEAAKTYKAMQLQFQENGAQKMIEMAGMQPHEAVFE